jgi:hypothetical protein
MLMKFAITVAIMVTCLVGLEVGSRAFTDGGLSVVSSAEARVGRPLTPVSVAGVARRTTRRCAVGVYNC